MKKFKSTMPNNQLKKCHAIIHSVSLAAGTFGAVPIPIADTIPISTTQVGMIILLGKVFDLTISRAIAEAIAGVSLAAAGGRFIASNILKAIPIVNVTVTPIVGASTAVTITETMGWIVADDFYRISVGENPEKIGKAAGDIYSCYKKIIN